MKYTYTCMLGISLCAAMLFTPVREAIVQGKPAQEAFSQPDILNSPEIMEGEEEPEEFQPEESAETTEIPQNSERQNPQDGEPEEAAEAETISREHFFDDALFIGDSRTVGLFEYADMGAADAFADSGMSLYKVMEVRLSMGDQGEKTLQEVLENRQYGRIYLMLGINELGYDQEATAKKYQELVQYLVQSQPQARLILEMNMHVSKKRSETDSIYNNANIDAFNNRIREIASEEGLACIDINERFDDGEGNLAEEYTADYAHLMGKYYAEWADWIYENR